MSFNLSTDDRLLIFLSTVPMEENIESKVVNILKRNENLNWRSIIDNAGLNSVFPQLYYNIKRLSLQDSIPQESLKVLEVLKTGLPGR